MVALDIDGTLMTFDEFMSPEIRETVAAVRDAGHFVVLATGRPLVATLPVAADLGIDSGWIVCSNGSVTARLDPALPGGFEVESPILFDPRNALDVLAEHVPDARVALEDMGTGYWITDLFPERDLHGRHTVLSFEELREQRTPRIIVADAPAPTREFSAAIASVGLIDTYFTIAMTHWMDLAPCGPRRHLHHPARRFHARRRSHRRRGRDRRLDSRRRRRGHPARPYLLLMAGLMQPVPL